MIVDTHVHYSVRKDFIPRCEKLVRYEFERRKYDNAIKSMIMSEEDSTLENWIDSMDRYGVDKIIMLPAPFGGNDSLADFVRKKPKRFTGLANIDFIDPVKSKSAQELERCVRNLGMRGIGELYPQVGPFDPGDEKCFPIYEMAQKLKVPVMMHFGSEPNPFFNDERYSDPYMLDPALRNFPDLNFIVSHMAIDFVGQLFSLMQCRSNLYTDVSTFTNGVPTPWFGLLDITPETVLRKFLDKIGPERLMWSMDVGAPYFSSSTASSFTLVKQKIEGTIKDNYLVKLMNKLNVNEKDKAQILGGTAIKIFGLE